MSIKVKSFRDVLKALHEYEVDYILVGGLAVILHDVPRVTEDIDIFVKRDAENLRKLKEGTLRKIDQADVIMLKEKLEGKK